MSEVGLPSEAVTLGARSTIKVRTCLPQTRNHKADALASAAKTASAQPGAVAVQHRQE